jgi:hypothetical protein
MKITAVYFTSALDRSTHMVAPTDHDYADVIIRALHWTPVVATAYSARRKEDVSFHAGYESIVQDESLGIGTYTVIGNTQACEAFVPGCTATADRRVWGYDFCLRCARAFAEYTPDPVHIID